MKQETDLVKKSLKNSNSIKLEKDEKNIEDLLSVYEKDPRPNYRMRMYRPSIPPLFNGYIPYTHLCNGKTIHVGGYVDQEFSA